MKILIVDDHDANLYMLEVLFESAGYGIVTAKNGMEALEKLRTSPVDAIVSDILMPVMDGFRLIRECKRDPLLRQIPFVFYTATYTEKKDEEFGLSLGAIRYLVKPAEPDVLLRQIREIFDEHARNPRDYTAEPVLDEATFNCEYARRVGAKLEKKTLMLAESEERFRLLFEHSMDAILLVDQNGTILAANPAACAMFGGPEEAIIKAGQDRIVDVADPRFLAAQKERERTGRFAGELTFFRSDGTRFPGEISSGLFTDCHGRRLSSVIVRDISERRNQERALQIANQKLNLMNIVAWHDIFNKITGLRGYVDLSRDHITDRRAEEFRRREEEILRVIQQQISYTMEYQEMGRHPPCWQRIRDLMQKVRMTGVAGSLRIVNEAENLEIYADPILEKVFWHLVDNSVKHGETVTEIRISAHESPSGCTLVYQDNGVGVPESKRKDLFTKSFGTMSGFDLFFVHDLLEISGMTIAETGERGKGARFEIGVPREYYRFVSD